MWIRTQQGRLINTESVAEIDFRKMFGAGDPPLTSLVAYQNFLFDGEQGYNVIASEPTNLQIVMDALCAALRCGNNFFDVQAILVKQNPLPTYEEILAEEPQEA